MKDIFLIALNLAMMTYAIVPFDLKDMTTTESVEKVASVTTSSAKSATEMSKSNQTPNDEEVEYADVECGPYLTCESNEFCSVTDYDPKNVWKY